MISCGVGTPSLDFTIEVLFSSRMMSMHKFNAFIADEYGRASDQLADFMLTLAAKGTIERVLRVTAIVTADFAHYHFLPVNRP